MRRALPALFSTALLLAAAPALTRQVPPAAARPAPAQPAPEVTREADPALWVVKDEDTTVYLFGTIHVLKPGLGWFDEAVKKAFDSSGELVVEMVEGAGADADAIRRRAVAAPDAPPLSERLPEDKRAAFARAVSALGVPPETFDRFQPWFAAVTLVQAPVGKLGYKAEDGVERRLMAAAEAAGKPMIGLETFDQQVGFLAGLSEEAQLRFLVSTVDEIGDTEKVFNEMIDSWSKGDPERLARLMNDTLKDEPEVEARLLTNRNKAWAGWIAERMKRPGTVFLAVGAGHLAGPSSVQAQLRNHGLAAERVPY